MSEEVVVAIGAHTDDIELGCGGTLHKYASMGMEVHAIALSIGRNDRCKILKESGEASSLLGAISHVHFFDARYMARDRQDVLDRIINWFEVLKPAIVFTHNSNDMHQDHQIVAMETIRAAFRLPYCNIYSYSFPWNTHRENKLDVYSSLSEVDLQAKVDALSCYSSQKHRYYMREDYTRARARSSAMRNTVSLLIEPFTNEVSFL